MKKHIRLFVGISLTVIVLVVSPSVKPMASAEARSMTTAGASAKPTTGFIRLDTAPRTQPPFRRNQLD